jgi:hypothetical protein
MKAASDFMPERFVRAGELAPCVSGLEPNVSLLSCHQFVA